MSVSRERCDLCRTSWSPAIFTVVCPLLVLKELRPFLFRSWRWRCRPWSLKSAQLSKRLSSPRRRLTRSGRQSKGKAEKRLMLSNISIIFSSNEKGNAQGSFTACSDCYCLMVEHQVEDLTMRIGCLLSGNSMVTSIRTYFPCISEVACSFPEHASYCQLLWTRERHEALTESLSPCDLSGI